MPTTLPYASVVLEGLSFVDGDENSSGIQENAWLIPREYFTTIAVPTPGVTPESLIEIAGPHVMATGKAPIPIYTQYENSGMDSTLTGEMFSKIWMNVVKFHMPQPNEQNSINFSILKNRRFIVLIKRMQGGSFIQIGCDGLFAKVKDGSVKMGDGPTGKPGIDFQIEAPGIHPFFVYTGVLPVIGV